MPDAIPDQSTLPYFIGKAPDAAHYAYFGSGAIRRIANSEVVLLRDEHKVRTAGIDQAAATVASTVSKTLFGV